MMKTESSPDGRFEIVARPGKFCFFQNFFSIIVKNIDII